MNPMDDKHDRQSAPIRVLLVDDQALMRMGFAMVLKTEPGIEVVGEAGDGVAAVVETGRLHPDLVLMDVRMPQMDGIEATRQIVALHPRTKVIVLTTFDMDEYAFGALRAGASGFLLKDVQPEALVAAIRHVATGDAAISPRVTRRMLELFADKLPGQADQAGAEGTAGRGGGAATGTATAVAGPNGATPAAGVRAASATPALTALAGLTSRERDVFDAVVAGLTNAEIAERLFVSETTVKTHVGNVLAKLDLRDRVQVVIWAYESGLAPTEGVDLTPAGPLRRG